MLTLLYDFFSFYLYVHPNNFQQWFQCWQKATISMKGKSVIHCIHHASFLQLFCVSRISRKYHKNVFLFQLFHFCHCSVPCYQISFSSLQWCQTKFREPFFIFQKRQARDDPRIWFVFFRCLVSFFSFLRCLTTTAYSSMGRIISTILYFHQISKISNTLAQCILRRHVILFAAFRLH